MRTAPGVTTALTGALAGAVDHGGGTARLQLRTGNAPASIGDAAAGTLLVEFALPSPVFAALTGGALAHSITPVAAVASGTVGHYRVLDRSGAAIIDGQSVDTSAAEIVVPSLSVVAGQSVSVTGWAFGTPVNTVIAAQSLPTIAQAGVGSMRATLTAAQAISPFTQALSGSASGGGEGLTAPTAAYTLGTQVGVPTGTSLTATSGLPTADLTGQTFARTDPVTGVAVSRTGVQKWVNRSWAATLSGTVPSGEVWWFDGCRFAPSGSNYFAFDVDTPSGPNSRLSPTLIFTNCEFGPGASGTADKGLTANRAWVENCDINRVSSGQGTCEDGWISAVYCTIIGTNIRAGIGLNTTDPHSDGLQITDTGGTAFYRAWIDGGPMTGALQGNAAIRVGTEFGATDGIDLFYCGLGGKSGNNVQFRGDSGGHLITNVRFRGNRWCTDGASFLYDFQQGGAGTMITEWTDNAFGTDCTIGGQFYAAGTTVPSPGV